MGRMTRERDNRRKLAEASKGSLEEDGGETGGDIDRRMDVDLM